MGNVDPSMIKAFETAAKQMQKAEKQGKMTSTKMKGFFDTIGKHAVSMGKTVLKAFAAFGTAAVAAAAAFGVQGLQLASDLQEVQNVVDVTFGEKGAAVIEEFSQSALKAFGLTELQAKEYTSTLGSMMKSSGITGDNLLIMSQNLTALAGDMASFKNLKPEEAFEKIRSGISGETEPLKQIGINMSVANMEAYALSQGITKAYKDMDQAEQTMLRYNYLLAQTGDMQRDFTNTSESFSNQQKLLSANFQQLAAAVMKDATPALAKVFKQMNEFMESIDPSMLSGLATAFIQVGASIMPMINTLLPPLLQLVNTLLPPLMELGNTLMPAIAELGTLIIEALTPILPVIVELAQALLPPLLALLKPIIKYISSAVKLIGEKLLAVIKIISPPLQFLADNILGPIADFLGAISSKVGGVISKIGEYGGWFMENFFGKGENVGKDFAPSMDGYADGGFASRPSIFGEAGLEAAIPIRPGNSRSLSLLDKAADLLGVGNRYTPSDNFQFTYSPQIYAMDAAGVQQVLDNDRPCLRDMLEDLIHDRERERF